MGALQGKTILLISPQGWGRMFISKHHYAIELARQGNLVYFLNPPDEKKNKRSRKISIEPSGVHENLFLIYHRLSFPYDLKFHFISLFHKLMKPHIKKILRHIGRPIDIIWSFDLGNLYPFELFPKSAKKIFHPVDEPLNQPAIQSAKGAEIIFSVTQEILDKYKQFGVPIYCINHGLSGEFILANEDYRPPGNSVRVGISGNFLRPDIDRDIMLEIITQNPLIIFECWGPFQPKQSNIGGVEDESMIKFVEMLRQLPNVILHGAVSASSLAREFQRMDAFLICYDVLKDQSKGTNYHKVIEYISTGKVVVSNNITSYQGMRDLVVMVTERENNKELPALFREVIDHLPSYNNQSLFDHRKSFALNNTYQKQVERISALLERPLKNMETSLIKEEH
jgi:glycosyltransferase involved in cell wall biosynthesis